MCAVFGFVQSVNLVASGFMVGHLGHISTALSTVAAEKVVSVIGQHSMLIRHCLATTLANWNLMLSMSCKWGLE